MRAKWTGILAGLVVGAALCLMPTSTAEAAPCHGGYGYYGGHYHAPRPYYAGYRAYRPYYGYRGYYRPYPYYGGYGGFYYGGPRVSIGIGW